jgi:hypothetical protein
MQVPYEGDWKDLPHGQHDHTSHMLSSWWLVFYFLLKHVGWRCTACPRLNARNALRLGIQRHCYNTVACPRLNARNALRLGIQRHCNNTVVNITETTTFNPVIPPTLSTNVFLRYVQQCCISLFSAGISNLKLTL